MIKLEKDIALATGVVIKKGAYIDLTGDGQLKIVRGNNTYYWKPNAIEIYEKLKYGRL